MSYAVESNISARKLKIRHAVGGVTVLQDGTAADADATRKFDDAFELGVDVYDNLVQAERIRVEVLTLESSYAGAKLTFRVHDRYWRNWLNLQVHDRIEFYCRRGDTISTSLSVPSWHHLAQTAGTQICIFYGRVTARSNARQESAEYMDFTCEDARSWANKLKIVRDYQNGVLLPHLVMNVEGPRDGDWIVSVKKTAANTYATGNVAAHAGRMTVYDGLNYLQTTYATDLVSRGIKATGVDLFDSTEISALTAEMPRMDFVNTGFAEAVDRILALVPDYGLVIDPRTKKWHIIKVRFDVVHGQVAVTSGAGTNNGDGTWTFPVDSSAIFSTTSGATGNRLLITDSTNPQFSDRVTVTAIPDATHVRVTAPNNTFGTGSTLVPLYSDAQRLPSVTVDLGEDAEAFNLEVDLGETFTAVRITASQNTVDDSTIDWAAGDEASKILKGWDTDFEPNWEKKHGDREADWGVGGLGIPVWRHEIINGKSRLKFKQVDSNFGADHRIVNQKSEWDGCAVKFLISLETAVIDQKPPIASRILKFGLVPDLDGMGNPGYYIDLAHNLLTHADGVEGVSSTNEPYDGNLPDRFIITQDLDLLDLDGAAAVGRLNARYEVYRTLVLTDTEVTVARNTQNQCQPIVSQYVQPGTGIRPETTFNPINQSSAPRTFQELEAFWTPKLGTPVGVGWAPRVFFLKQPAQQAFDAHAACLQALAAVGGARPQPQRIELKVRNVKNEVCNVRVPANGFSGLAKIWHNLQEELILETDDLKTDADKVRWQAIAESVWRQSSTPSYRGSIPLPGVQQWLGLGDLGLFVALATSVIPQGSANEIYRFGAVLSRVVFDFTRQATSIEFANRGVLASLNQAVLSDLFIDAAAREKKTRDMAEAANHAAECANRPINHAPQQVGDCETSATQYGRPTPGRRAPAPIPPKEEELELTESSASFLGAPSGSSANIGPESFGIIEKDLLGQEFFSDGRGIRPGRRNGMIWTPDDAMRARLTGLAHVLKRDFSNIMKALVGLDLAYPSQPLHARIGAGATTTTIPIQFPLMDPSEFVGGEVMVLDQTARPPYAIASHTDRVVTLSAPMDEAVPAEGMLAVVRPALKPQADPRYFPSGSTTLKDAAGNWFVATPEGHLVPGSLSSGAIVPASSTTAPSLLLERKYDIERRTMDWEAVVEFAANQQFDNGAGTVASANPSQTSDATVYASVLGIYNWTDASQRGNLFQVRLPGDLDPRSPITARFVGSLSTTPGATDKIEIEIDARATKNGEARNSGGTTVKITSGAVVIGSSGKGYSAGTVFEIDLGTLFSASTIEPGDTVHGVAYRDANLANADDVYTGNVQALHLVLRGKRFLTGADNRGNAIGGRDASDTLRTLAMVF